jgi:hypothetical protein
VSTTDEQARRELVKLYLLILLKEARAKPKGK